MPDATRTAAATILLVEDDELLREAFRLLLEDAGYRVGEAGTAADALAWVSDETPSLVVLDMGLPDRSGLDVARAMRDKPHTRDVPILALTGHVDDSSQQACLDAGCTAYSMKPLDPRELLERLATLLD